MAVTMKMEDFGVNIVPSGVGLKYLRSQKGLTQEALADALGMSLTTVARWERGVFEPTKEHREALEKYCQDNGISYDQMQVGVLILKLISNHDSYTAEHCFRVCLLASAAAKYIDGIDILELRIGTLLHDLGKILIERKMLNKPSKYNDKERKIMKNHTVVSELLVSLLMVGNTKAAVIAGQHHEKINGGGYKGLREKDLLPESKLLAICDCFDACTTKRHHNKVKTVERALVELQDDRGLDQEMVAAFIKAVRQKGVLESLESDDHLYQYENRRAFYGT